MCQQIIAEVGMNSAIINITGMRAIFILLLIFCFTSSVKSQQIIHREDSYWGKSIVLSNENILPANYHLKQMSYSAIISSFKNETGKKYDSKNKQAIKLKAKIFSRMYAKFYGGYGFLTPGSYSVQSTNVISYYDKNGDQHNTTIQSQGRKGVGGGVRFGGGIGYVLNDFLNLGIDAEYLMGAKLTNSISSFSDTGFFSSSTSDRMDYKSITLSPHIIFKALAKPKYYIYNKLGILLTLPYTLNTSGNSISSWAYNWHPGIIDSSLKSSSNKNSTYEGKYKISMGIGFNVAFGVNFRIGNKLRAFGEIFGNFSALSPSSSQVITTTSQLDSVYRDNKLSLVPETEYSTTNTKYQKEGLTINHITEDLRAPGERTLTYSGQAKKFTVNMNVMGISAGIVYRF